MYAEGLLVLDAVPCIYTSYLIGSLQGNYEVGPKSFHFATEKT